LQLARFEMKYTFEWTEEGEDIYVAGDFNNWTDVKMVERKLVVDLPAGNIQYKFLVDGEWRCDSSKPTAVSPRGDLNNVISVPDENVSQNPENTVPKSGNTSEEQVEIVQTVVEKVTESVDHGLLSQPPTTVPPLSSDSSNKIFYFFN
jgi:hypothetical protein